MHSSHRRIIALTGSREWSHQAACALLEAHPHEDILWVGDTVPAELAITPFARRQQLLGDDYGMAIIDAWSGFDPDQFGAAHPGRVESLQERSVADTDPCHATCGAELRELLRGNHRYVFTLIHKFQTPEILWRPTGRDRPDR